MVQYFLSRLTPPWPGLILPILSGAFSLFFLLLIFMNLIGISPTIVFTLLLILAVLNLPTVIFVLIYRVTRRRFQQKSEVERMNLQDL